MKLQLIYAQAANGVIGKDNTLPWHLPEDLAHFKRLTLGCPVIMGRKTWDSLPPAFRPLPGRRNIVITRQTDWQTDGAICANSLEQATAYCDDAPIAWVIGGATIYEQALPHASLVSITEIHQVFEGDALAPVLSPNDWQETTRESHVSSTGLKFDFVTYTKAN